MQETVFGTVVLHVSPNSNVGGRLALVKTGDIIELNCQLRQLILHVNEDELSKHRDNWTLEETRYSRDYTSLYIQTVNQANTRADLNFLTDKSGSFIKREPHPK